jgi:DNA polymerase
MCDLINIHGDFETYSEVDLKNVGPWAYSMHHSTKVLCFAYSLQNNNPDIWLPGEPIPDLINFWLDSRGNYKFHAWNDFFEYCIMRNVLKWGPLPEPKYWSDTAAKAAVLALPRSLGDCGKALNLSDNLTKDTEGKKLLDMFSKPKKVKGELCRTYPEDKPGDFKKLIEYCKQDVIAEREINKILRPLQKETRRIWELDREINLRGVRFDYLSASNAITIREQAKKVELKKVEKITNGKLLNINSRNQFMEYLLEYESVFIENAQREYLKNFQKTLDKKSTAYKLIESRLKISKSGLKKYDKLLEIIPLMTDTAHGLLRFHGASTGRWSGNLFQPQNLPRPSHKDTWWDCVELFKYEDYTLIEMLYCNALEALNNCLRGVIIASPGNRLIVSDFSQIESRLIRWFAGDKEGLKIYENGLDIYKQNAVGAFKTHYGEVTDDQRLIGKVIELACGYQGAVGAFQSFAAVYGVIIPDDEAEAFVKAWRLANPKIVSAWHGLEGAAVKAVANPGSTQTYKNVKYRVIGSGELRFLNCKLPSGRILAYHKPELVEGPYNDQIRYWGVDSQTHKYCRQQTYGGKLTNNVIQATAYDRMVYSMFKLKEKGYPIILTVHDEILCDVPNGKGSIKEMNEIMCINPPWAEDLPVEAEGYEAKRYRK